MKSYFLLASFFIVSLASYFSAVAHAERIRDLTTIQGVRDNTLMGYGLVVGLDGTGDQTTQTPFTTQSLNNMLSQLGITLLQHLPEALSGENLPSQLHMTPVTSAQQHAQPVQQSETGMK